MRNAQIGLRPAGRRMSNTSSAARRARRFWAYYRPLATNFWGRWNRRTQVTCSASGLGPLGTSDAMTGDPLSPTTAHARGDSISANYASAKGPSDDGQRATAPPTRNQLDFGSLAGAHSLGGSRGQSIPKHPGRQRAVGQHRCNLGRLPLVLRVIANVWG